MKIKAIELLNKFEALNKLADKELDLSSACAVAKNLQELATYKTEIDKKRDNLVITYAEKDEKGDISRFEDGGIKISDAVTFNEEISKLLDTDLNVDFVKLNKKMLADIKISAKDIMPLMDILEGDD